MLGMALIGAGFVSECFLLQMLFASDSFQYLGMLAAPGRAVHFAAGLFVLVKVNSHEHALHRLMNDEMRVGNKVFSVVSLLCLLDATLVPFLPWLDSGFAEKTSGYPTRAVFLLCVYSKIGQSLLVLVCQVVYLKHVLEVAATLPAMPASVAFLALNIAVTGLVFVINLVEAANKTSSLRDWERLAGGGDDVVGGGGGEAQGGEAGLEAGEEARGRGNSSSGGRATRASTVAGAENPMHRPSAKRKSTAAAALGKDKDGGGGGEEEGAGAAPAIEMTTTIWPAFAQPSPLLFSRKQPASGSGSVSAPGRGEGAGARLRLDPQPSEAQPALGPATSVDRIPRPSVLGAVGLPAEAEPGEDAAQA